MWGEIDESTCVMGVGGGGGMYWSSLLKYLLK